MKRMAILLILLTCSLFSQTYYLKVWSKGNVTVVPVSDIRKITFDTTAVGINNDKAAAVLNAFELFQNYPNPFNPSTRIDYQIPSAGNIKIQIYKITGELVRALVNAEQPAGKYSIIWNGKDENNCPAASGVYFYRVIFGNSVLSKKMILIK